MSTIAQQEEQMGLPVTPEPPKQAFRPPNIALTTVGLALASFMQVLDTTIANVSLPTISGNLGASANQATWVITSFAVSNAIALPLAAAGLIGPWEAALAMGASSLTVLLNALRPLNEPQWKASTSSFPSRSPSFS